MGGVLQGSPVMDGPFEAAGHEEHEACYAKPCHALTVAGMLCIAYDRVLLSEGLRSEGCCKAHL